MCGRKYDKRGYLYREFFYLYRNHPDPEKKLFLVCWMCNSQGYMDLDLGWVVYVKKQHSLFY